MRARLLCLALLIGCGFGCGSVDEPPDLQIITEDATDLPISGLSGAQQTHFDEGDRLFEHPYVAAQGLGPHYVRRACAACHEGDAKGPGFVMRMEISKRVGPAVFGRGYLEAIAASELERVEAEQSARSDGISGRINRVVRHSEANPDDSTHALQKDDADLIGRFGVKARVATLDDFCADALQGDMGLTSPLRPEELPNPDGLSEDQKPGIDVSLETVNRLTEYVRFLAIPRREAPGRGAMLFEDAQCAACHVPKMRIDERHPLFAIAGESAPAYTDLLLHDMGDALADGVPDESSTSREWRTAPLIGLRHLRSYLHDGRAATVLDAIAQHRGEGSEANVSVDRFDQLSSGDRDELVRFVSTL